MKTIIYSEEAWLNGYERQRKAIGIISGGGPCELYHVFNVLGLGVIGYALLCPWSAYAFLGFFSFLLYVWDLHLSQFIREGVIATGEITNRKKDCGKYYVQFIYSIGDATYKCNEAWFQVPKRIYCNASDALSIRYLPHDPSACLPRHTLYMRDYACGSAGASMDSQALSLDFLLFLAFLTLSCFMNYLVLSPLVSQDEPRLYLACVLSTSILFTICSSYRDQNNSKELFVSSLEKP